MEGAITAQRVKQAAREQMEEAGGAAPVPA